MFRLCQDTPENWKKYFNNFFFCGQLSAKLRPQQKRKQENHCDDVRSMNKTEDIINLRLLIQ